MDDLIELIRQLRNLWRRHQWSFRKAAIYAGHTAIALLFGFFGEIALGCGRDALSMAWYGFKNGIFVQAGFGIATLFFSGTLCAILWLLRKQSGDLVTYAERRKQGTLARMTSRVPAMWVCVRVYVGAVLAMMIWGGILDASAQSSSYVSQATSVMIDTRRAELQLAFVDLMNGRWNHEPHDTPNITAIKTCYARAVFDHDKILDYLHALSQRRRDIAKDVPLHPQRIGKITLPAPCSE